MRRKWTVVDMKNDWKAIYPFELRVMDTLAKPAAATADMVRIPGGTFRMGSDQHYPEEAPAHRVTVDGFWIDATPVTNAPVPRTSSRRPATSPGPRSLPDPKDYPGASPTC